jgi:hypothetical protein
LGDPAQEQIEPQVMALVQDQPEAQAVEAAVVLTVLEARAVVQLVVQLAVQAQAVEAAVALVETRVAAEQSQKQT